MNFLQILPGKLLENLTAANDSVQAAATNDTINETVEITDKINYLFTLSPQDMLSTILDWLMKAGWKLTVALVIFITGRWIIKRIDSLIKKLMERRNIDLSLRTFLLSLLNILMSAVLITILVDYLGIDTTSLVALIASAGLAVGMALSGTLQNFAGGVMIIMFKPYRVGDFIEAQGQTGIVKEIQIFNTIINTVDNKTIIVPNGGLSTGIVNNYSKEETRRVDWTFGIAYGDNYDTAKALLLRLLNEDSRVLKSPEPFIALSSLGDSSVNIVVRAWAKSTDYWDIYFSMNEKVYKQFGENGLNIPFPQMDVHLHSKN